MKDIFSLSPINKTAAIVTSQAGCEDNVSLIDLRDSLRKSRDSLQYQLDKLPPFHRYRNELNQKIDRITLELALLRKQKKFVGAKDRDLNNYILDVIKENVPAYKFKEWLSIARARKESALKNDGGSQE